MINKDILRMAITDRKFGIVNAATLANVASMTDDEVNIVLSAYIENKKTELGNQISFATERLNALQQQLAAVTKVS
jgi:hypothetical protein